MKRWLLLLVITALWVSTLTTAQEVRRRPIVVAAGGVSWTEIAHTVAGAGGGDHTTVTTPAINTTGADLLVAVASKIANGGAPITGDLTDSKSNTWTMLTPINTGGGYGVMYYSRPTTVGTGHTFTFARSGTDIYPGLCVFAVSGSASSPFDVQSGGTTTNTSVQPGSITPSQDNELIISGLAFFETESGTPAIDSGMTIRDYLASNAGGEFTGVALAWKTQTTAAAINPTWSAWTPSRLVAAMIASFKKA